MRKPLLAGALLSLSLALAAPGCGGLLSQAVSVQRAVESKNYDVDRVGVAKDGSGKKVTVYMNQDFDQSQKAEIAETAQGVVPDANEIEVVAPGKSRPNTSRPDTARPNE